MLALRKPTVLLLTNGGAVAIDSLVAAATRTAATPGPAAIVEAFSPCTNAHALAALLYGANSWGKLPITIYPASFAEQADAASFDMAKPPGRTYKYFNATPLWSFGHGLSYSEFTLACARKQGGAPLNVSVSCTVANVGGSGGDEVVQVYHAAGADVRAEVAGRHPVPRKALVDFERVHVAAGASATVGFELGRRALELVNATGGRQLYAGSHNLIFSRGHGADVLIEVQVP